MDRVATKLRRRQHVIIVLSGKGGVGKTTLARLIGEMLRERDPGVTLVDGNGAVGQLMQYLGSRGADGKLRNPQPELGGVLVCNMHGDERDRDGLLDVLSSEAGTILIDLPAESLGIIERMRDELGLFDVIAGDGNALTLVSPMTPFRASVRDVQTVLQLAPAARHVIVRNLAFGMAEDPARNDPGDWQIWLQSKTRAEAEQIGAIVVDLPALRPRIMASLDSESLSFAAGTTSHKLSIADRQRLHVWLRAAKAALDPMFAALGIPVIAAKEEVPA